MTENNRLPLEEGESAEARPEHIETRVASGTVRFRMGPDRATASIRLGTVLLIALLLAAAAYIARTPPDAGDASASQVPDPSASQVADATDSYDVAMTLRPRFQFDVEFSFFEELDPSVPDGTDPGRLLAEIDGQFSVNPENSCP